MTEDFSDKGGETTQQPPLAEVVSKGVAAMAVSASVLVGTYYATKGDFSSAAVSYTIAGTGGTGLYFWFK